MDEVASMKINDDKKGVELSMNLIIIAAIALLVLVIIAVLVLRAPGPILEQTSCQAKTGGVCIASADSCPTDTIYTAAGGCPKETPKCCSKSPV